MTNKSKPAVQDFNTPPPEQGDLLDAGARLKLQLNDCDNVRRLAAVLRDRMLYVPGWGWGVWDGRRFNFTAGQEMALRLAATELPKAIIDEAAAGNTQPVAKFQISDHIARHPGTSPDQAETMIKAAKRKKYKDYALGCGNKWRAKAALELARSLFRVDVEYLDADPWRLTCENGLLDLTAIAAPTPIDEDKTERARRWAGALGPFDPGLRGTRKPAVAFDPGATAPAWRLFVDRAFPDPENAAYFRRAMAATLAGRNERQMVLILLGQGGNGKSTAVNALARVLGGYGATCRIELFLESKYQSSSGATPEEAVLPGARAYLADEPEAAAVLSASKIKGMTGGATRQSRALHGRPFDWVPNGIPVLSFNKMPRITDETEGMWRRLVPVHLTVKLHEPPADQRVSPAAMERLINDEASGILNWLLEGWAGLADRAACPNTMLQGLDPPGKALALKAQLRAMADPVGEFLGDCTERSRGGRIQASEIHRVYERWCANNGAEPMGLRLFGRTMLAKDYTKRKISNMCWVDVSWVQREDIDTWREEKPGDKV